MNAHHNLDDTKSQIGLFNTGELMGLVPSLACHIHDELETLSFLGVCPREIGNLLLEDIRGNIETSAYEYKPRPDEEFIASSDEPSKLLQRETAINRIQIADQAIKKIISSIMILVSRGILSRELAFQFFSEFDNSMNIAQKQNIEAGEIEELVTIQIIFRAFLEQQTERFLGTQVVLNDLEC